MTDADKAAVDTAAWHRGASHGGPSCRIVGCPHYNVWWRRLRRRVLGV